MNFESSSFKELTLKEFLNIAPALHKKPYRGLRLLRYLTCKFALRELNNNNFEASYIGGISEIPVKEPSICLMNHSSKVDLEIFAKILKDRNFYMVVTHDAFVGNEFLMRAFNNIPTKKYITDLHLIEDISYVAKKYKRPILIFPEASWSMAGTTSEIPKSLGGMLKYFKLPVYCINTYGAFQMRPNYNNAHNSKEIKSVPIKAYIERIFTTEELKKADACAINKKIKEKFCYDQFRWQFENKIKIDENFTAKGLHRVIYKCPHCLEEGKMSSNGTTLTCKNCKKAYELTEYGKLAAIGFDGAFEYASDWYNWENNCVKDQIKNNEYECSSDVEIVGLRDYKYLYRLGKGYIKQDNNSIKLFDKDNKLIFEYPHTKSYSLNINHYFYSDNDSIGIGNNKEYFYAFTDYEQFPVLKARFALENAYKLAKGEDE